jgi:hypothetical protein
MTISTAGATLVGNIVRFKNSTSLLGILKSLSIDIVDIYLPLNVQYSTKYAIFVMNCTYAFFSPEPFSKISCLAMVRSLFF